PNETVCHALRDCPATVETCARLGFSMNQSDWNVPEAPWIRNELRGAISGLELVWEFGYHLVELQLDSKVAINILTASEDPHHQHAT
ncbi:hypothetical protein LINPERHAP2_LOCUS16505, partial [Linum perenne]